MTRFSRLACLHLLGYIAYAPWHDAISLGQRIPLGETQYGAWLSFLPSQLTTSGLANTFWIASCALALLVLILPTIKKEKIGILDALVLVWPLFLLSRGYPFDYSSMVPLANGILFSLFLLFVIRRQHLQESAKIIASNGYFVLLISYSLAITIPFLIPIEGYRLFERFLNIYRFRGWVGEGQPIGFIGMLLMAWALFRGLERRKIKFYDVYGFLIGLLGVYINVLRIALLSAAIVVFAAFIFEWIRANRKTAIACGVGSLLLFGMQFVGSFYTKNFSRTVFDNEYELREYDRNALGVQFENEIRDFIIGNFAGAIQLDKKFSPGLLGTGSERFIGISKLDSIIITNGRAETLSYLLMRSGGPTLFGYGLGYVNRTIKGARYASPEIGGDYFRLLFEVGYFGLVYFIMMLFAIIFAFRDSRLPLVIVLASCAFLTDVILIVPTFGYGPILLLSTIIPAKSHHSLHSLSLSGKFKMWSPYFRRSTRSS